MTRPPRRRGDQILQTLPTVFHVYADHGNGVLHFVALCTNREQVDRYILEMTHISDVYVMPHRAEKYWRHGGNPASEAPRMIHIDEQEAAGNLT